MKTLVRVGNALMITEEPQAPKHETLEDFCTRMLVLHLRHREWLIEHPEEYSPFKPTTNAYPK